MVQIRVCRLLKHWVLETRGKSENKVSPSHTEYVVKVGDHVPLSYCLDLCPDKKECDESEEREELWTGE